MAGFYLTYWKFSEIFYGVAGSFGGGVPGIWNLGPGKKVGGVKDYVLGSPPLPPSHFVPPTSDSIPRTA